MPVARALEKRDEKLSLRVPLEKHLVNGFVEDPGRVTSRQRDPTRPDPKGKTQGLAEKPSSRAQKLL